MIFNKLDWGSNWVYGNEFDKDMESDDSCEWDNKIEWVDGSECDGGVEL